MGTGGAAPRPALGAFSTHPPSLGQVLADYASENLEAMNPPLFLRFLNLLMNDAIFLLDEAIQVGGSSSPTSLPSSPRRLPRPQSAPPSPGQSGPDLAARPPAPPRCLHGLTVPQQD